MFSRRSHRLVTWYGAPENSMRNGLTTHMLECLIDSFEPDTTVDDAWIEEAQQRRDEVSSGAASLVPGDEAVARVRQHIG